MLLFNNVPEHINQFTFSNVWSSCLHLILPPSHLERPPRRVATPSPTCSGRRFTEPHTYKPAGTRIPPLFQQVTIRHEQLGGRAFSDQSSALFSERLRGTPRTVSGWLHVRGSFPTDGYFYYRIRRFLVGQLQAILILDCAVLPHSATRQHRLIGPLGQRRERHFVHGDFLSIMVLLSCII